MPKRTVTKPEPAVTPLAAGTGSRFQSPLDSKDTAGAKQRFVELLVRKLNAQVEDPVRDGLWDFWSDGSSGYLMPGGEMALLMSFRRTAPTSQEGFLVIGTIHGQNTVVHGYWRVPAGIDDIHVMDMGVAGPMIYTVSFDTSGKHRRIFHHLLRFDGERIHEVWSFDVSYEVDQPKTYKHVSVSFRDEDGDGTREVRVRLPGAETPRLWKHRWALFRWDPGQNEFLPLRGLAFTPAAMHRPHWAAFGFLEALGERSLKDARRFGSEAPGCRAIDDLWEVFMRRSYRPVGIPRRAEVTEALRSGKSTVVVDLERPKDSNRYQAHILLRHTAHTAHISEAPPGEEGWRICLIRFFRL